MNMDFTDINEDMSQSVYIENGGFLMLVLCIYCAGGIGRDILSLMNTVGMNMYDEIIFIDDMVTEKFIDGKRVITFKQFLEEEYIKNDCEVIIANGEPLYRKMIYQKIKKYNIHVGKLLLDSSIIALDAKVGDGSIIHCQSIISAGSSIGENVFVNKNSMIGHNVEIGNNCVIGACSFVGGWVRIHEGCYIGSNASIRDRVTIGKNCIIGIGSVVTKSVADNMVVVGNPARFIRMNEEEIVFAKKECR